jgi:hypothetical protein
MSILKVLAACLIAMSVPLAAYADDVVLTNNGGTFTSTPVTISGGVTSGTYGQTTLSFSGSYLVGISGLSDFGISNQSASYFGAGNVPDVCGACLGNVTLTTEPLTGGVLNQPGSGFTIPIATFGGEGTFSATGPNGMVFSGTISSTIWSKPAPGTFSLVATTGDGIHSPADSQRRLRDTVNIDLTTNGAGEITHPSNGSVSFSNDQGATSFLAPVPEPSTLALLGTGLIFVGIVVRRFAA